MKQAILLKPLDGMAIGSSAEFADADFERLERLGAVKAAPHKKAEPAPANKAEPAPANKSAKKKGD